MNMSLDDLDVLTVDYPVGGGGAYSGGKKVLVMGRWRRVIVVGRRKCVRYAGHVVRLRDLLEWERVCRSMH